MAGVSEPFATVAGSIRHVAGALAAAGVENAQSEARRLVSAALGWSAAALIGRSGDALSPEQCARIAGYLDRRRRHEPLSRILGEREFYGRPFLVSPATLDPRADSETLVDATLELLREAGQTAARLRILDIGTGTGCLLLTLLLELPDATGVGTDASGEALAVARANARRLGVEDRVHWSETDVVDGLAGAFDVVVSNPPYVRSADIAGLPESVRGFDPPLALDGGGDGLRFYRRIIADLPPLLQGAGLVVFEVGCGQAPAVTAALTRPGMHLQFDPPRIFEDVSGIHRVVAARARSVGLAEKALGFSGPAR